jgi:hypothetical protein
VSDLPRHFGKFRGMVVNNVDPMQIGRVQVQVPDVLGPALSSWAMPCVPLAGKQSGVYVVPQVGSGVWVEFEQGDPDYPIWVGGFWGSAAEVPALALAGLPVSPSIVLQTGSQMTLMLSDLPGPTGGILLKAGAAMISISDIGITITNGMGATITMSAGPVIDLNAGALTVVS